jgi:anti-sigma regulatory factor (Ser/Thr protein kinase)
MTHAMSCSCESGFRIRGGPQAARDARSALTSELAERITEARLRDLHLVVSEIVNNSVMHGEVGEDGWIAIDLAFRAELLRVTVRDSSLQGTPVQRPPDYEDGGGFGLFLVDAVCSNWGVEREPVLTVWFELALDGAP